ncbi:MAG: hypothetical protein ABIE14_05635 [Patescibacteria group bacterium]
MPYHSFSESGHVRRSLSEGGSYSRTDMSASKQVREFYEEMGFTATF